jgi:hypothetical protein
VHDHHGARLCKTMRMAHSNLATLVHLLLLIYRCLLRLTCADCHVMARRRQEIALQTEIETQEEWNESINKEGLTGNEKNIE